MTAPPEHYRDPVEPADSHLGALIEVAHDGVVVLDRLGIIRYASPANERNFARKPEEVIGHNISEFVHPDDLSDLQTRLGRDLPSDAEIPIVYRTHQPDGRWRWFEAIKPRMDGHFVPDHFIFFIRDITRHRRIEQQYRMAERLAGCGVWRVDFDDPYPDLSPGMLHVLGFQPGEQGRMPKYWPIMKVHPSDANAVLKTLRHVMQAPQQFSFCCRVRTRDGSIKRLKTKGHVETDANGAGVAIIGVSQDITLISLAAKKLETSEEKYRLLAEQASDIICKLSPEGTIKFISPSVERITGRRSDKVTGRHFNTLLAAEDHESFDRFLTQLQQGGEDDLCTVRAADDDSGQLWLELSGRTLRDSAGAAAGFVCMARDITERKQFEVELQESRQQAEEASATKSKFLTNVSHELRTPLNAIMGFSELIREQAFGPVGDARYSEYAGLIHESGGMLKTLINDLLDLSRIEAGKYELNPEHLELKDIVPSCIQQIMPQAMKKGIAVNDRISGMELGLRADRRALTQILINLLSNAVKFTPEGGQIDVTAHEEDERLRLSVHDTGIGIKKEDLERVTVAFEQVTDEFNTGRRKGTGLGLALAKSLAELHGGELLLESEPDKGTTASVILPAGATCRAVA